MISKAWQPRLLVVLLGLAAFGPALNVGFLYDDHLLIERNTSLRSWSAENVAHDFSTGVFNDPQHLNYYRPLQTLSTRIEYTLWGLHPLGYHLTNLLVHLANAILLMEFFIILGIPALTATVAGSLFVVNPLIVEPLMMVSGRGELFGFFFTVSSLLLLLSDQKKRQLLGLAAYVAGLLCKESVIVTPAFLVLALYIRKEPADRYKSLLPMALLTISYLGLRHWAVGRLLPISPAILLRFSWMAFPKVLFTYTRLILIPWHLHTDRMLPPGPFWLLNTLGLGGLAVWAITQRSRWPVFCFLWYVTALLPKIPLMVLESFMCEHWAYPAIVAVVLPISLFLVQGYNAPSRTVRRLSLAAFLVLLMGWTTLAELNIAWRGTDEGLYRSAVQYSASPIMRFNLALVLLNQGRAGDAIPLLESLVREDPTNTAALNNLAAARRMDHPAR